MEITVSTKELKTLLKEVRDKFDSKWRSPLEWYRDYKMKKVIRQLAKAAGRCWGSIRC